MDRVIVYVDKAPTVRIEDGLAHIQDRSGEVVFERVMPVGALRETIRTANRALDEYAERGSAEIIPISRKRRPRGA